MYPAPRVINTSISFLLSTSRISSCLLYTSHRLEKVCRVRGVDYINDSKATNVNSCWYALQSMKTKTSQILGGNDKGNDYNEIADLGKEKCTGLIYMGLHNEKLHDFFDKFGRPVADEQSMKDAVDAAYRMEMCIRDRCKTNCHHR